MAAVLDSIRLASEQYFIDIRVADVMLGYLKAPKEMEDMEDWMDGLSLLSYATVCSFIGDGSALDEVIDIHYSYILTNSIFDDASRQVPGPSKKLNKDHLICRNWGVGGLFSIEDLHSILIFTFTGEHIYISKSDFFGSKCESLQLKD